MIGRLVIQAAMLSIRLSSKLIMCGGQLALFYDVSGLDLLAVRQGFVSEVSGVPVQMKGADGLVRFMTLRSGNHNLRDVSQTPNSGTPLMEYYALSWPNSRSLATPMTGAAGSAELCIRIIPVPNSGAVSQGRCC